MASIAAAAAAAAAIYFTVVPSETINLETLSSAKIPQKKRAAVAALYPPPEPDALTQLSAGTTCYSITGSESGKRIILVHGISGTWASMPHVVSSLTQHGFRVLAYDLYGRGHSSSPGIRYTASDYALQMKDLMDHVGWDRANVLGYSLGGGIAASFADVWPERVDKLVLVAPAGLSKDIPLGGRFLLLPIIGPLITYTAGSRILSYLSRRNHNALYAKQPHMQHFINVQDLNIRIHPGFMRAYIGTVRNGPIRGMGAVYRRVGEKFGDRIQCIWGRDDKVVNFEKQAPLFRKLAPRAQFIELQGGHSILPETSEKVVDRVVDFL
ncbi:hypothetical protein CcCBS67573_g09353 [Chytriomyces confervae]|uniref:AB hydrolase-1 domain-containing protein n=1 Tax=Chytriomyces confervae TaxID=246404 RepID=A0A507DYA7_9FUNG|nr:hypothetical protein CcCBS67573_g09353 [Chytriomyces confervae]